MEALSFFFLPPPPPPPPPLPLFPFLSWPNVSQSSLVLRQTNGRCPCNSAGASPPSLPLSLPPPSSSPLVTTLARFDHAYSSELELLFSSPFEPPAGLDEAKAPHDDSAGAVLRAIGIAGHLSLRDLLNRCAILVVAQWLLWPGRRSMRLSSP